MGVARGCARRGWLEMKMQMKEYEQSCEWPAQSSEMSNLGLQPVADHGDSCKWVISVLQRIKGSAAPV